MIRIHPLRRQQLEDVISHSEVVERDGHGIMVRPFFGRSIVLERPHNVSLPAQRRGCRPRDRRQRTGRVSYARGVPHCRRPA